MRCKYINGCKKQAVFGFEDNKLVRYKLDKMEDIISPKCIHIENGKRCITQPNYN